LCPAGLGRHVDGRDLGGNHDLARLQRHHQHRKRRHRHEYPADLLDIEGNQSQANGIKIGTTGGSAFTIFDDGNPHIENLTGATLWINGDYASNVSIDAAGGNVGIGTANPVFPLDIAGGITIVASNYGCTTGYGALGSIGATGNNSCSNSFSVSLRTQNRILAPEVDATSDMRLKNFVTALSPPSALAAVEQLKPLFFKWKPEARQSDTSLKVGFFAQQVAPYVPVAVSQAPGVLKDQYFLNYDALIPYLVSAVQELQAENEQLKARINRDTASRRVSYAR
jgi:hypothetical protein